MPTKDPKADKDEKERKEQMKQMENRQDGSFKPNYISNYIKDKPPCFLIT